MGHSTLGWLSLPCLLLALAAPAYGQGKFGQEAPDFPPGLFTDGLQHSVSEGQGKLVVLYFFDSQCPRCKGMVPQRGAVVKAMKDKPILFLAVGANITMNEAQAYQQQTGLAMPIYADSLGLMQKRYGTQISLRNIWQFRVIGPDGKIIGYDMGQEALTKALEATKVERKYKSQGYDAKLEPVLDALEWGQVAQATKLLGPLRKSTNKALAESANKLFAEIKQEGEQWKTEAAQAVESEPLKAHDLYSKVATTFAGDELAKSVADPLKKLAANKTVKALAARKAFGQYPVTVSRLTAAQKPLAVKFCQDIAKKHAKTPTAEKALALEAELGK